MKTIKKIRRVLSIVLVLILTFCTRFFVTEAKAGQAYTIRVGETVNITFRYPGAMSQQWWGIDRSIADIVSADQNVNTITVVGISPGETAVKTQVTYPQQSFAYGETFTITQWTQDTSIIRVLPADNSSGSSSNTTNSSSATAYDEIIFDHMYDGMIAAVKDGKMGFLDKNYDVVIPFKYHYDPSWNIHEYYEPDGQSNRLRLWQFNQGVALVCKPTNYPDPAAPQFKNIFIDKTGKEIDFVGGDYGLANFANMSYIYKNVLFRCGKDADPADVSLIFDLKTGVRLEQDSYVNGFLELDYIIKKYGKFWEGMGPPASPLPSPTSKMGQTSKAPSAKTTGEAVKVASSYTIGVGDELTISSPFPGEEVYAWSAYGQSVIKLTSKNSTCTIKALKQGRVVVGHAAISGSAPAKSTTYTIIVK